MCFVDHENDVINDPDGYTHICNANEIFFLLPHVGGQQKTMKTKAADFDKVIDVNLKGTFLVSKEAMLKISLLLFRTQEIMVNFSF